MIAWQVQRFTTAMGEYAEADKTKTLLCIACLPDQYRYKLTAAQATVVIGCFCPQALLCRVIPEFTTSTLFNLLHVPLPSTSPVGDMQTQDTDRKVEQATRLMQQKLTTSMVLWDCYVSIYTMRLAILEYQEIFKEHATMLAVGLEYPLSLLLTQVMPPLLSSVKLSIYSYTCDDATVLQSTVVYAGYLG